MSKYLILLFIGIVLSCNSNHYEYGDAQLLESIKTINISDLEKNPADFDNDTLRLSGDLHLDLENKGIFLKSHDIWIRSFRPATEVDSAWHNMNGRKVEIIGLYQAGQTGHLGLFDGQFKEVYYIKTN